uniref:peptidylprolyl isomerase n=1 Tax=Podarcis muralis TaxID=64176 RepID=A0A670HU84_PODMU
CWQIQMTGLVAFSVGEGPPKYTKSVLKKGDKINFPQKGDVVYCWYTGKLQDGTVFDSNIQTSSKKKKAAKPLSFKVGIGKVIRGWDEALLTMSKGEKAHLEIERVGGGGELNDPAFLQEQFVAKQVCYPLVQTGSDI